MKKKSIIKKKYKYLSLILIIFTILLLWSRYISTSGLLIKEYNIINSNLPISFDGLKVVHFSDIHYGRTIKAKELEYFVNEVNSLNPDLIFFTGDLIDKDTKLSSKSKKEIVTILSKLDASIGKYAIAGNHDLKFKEYKDIIETIGFININNSYDIIFSNKYETIYICGLETEVSGNPDIDKATEYLVNNEDNDDDVPSYKILLLHTPDTFDKVKEYNFNLVLGGHSHNGQIRLPFIGTLVTPIGSKKYYEPYYKIEETELYISGGIGTSKINFRFFNKPSFNFYRLTTK